MDDSGAITIDQSDSSKRLSTPPSFPPSDINMGKEKYSITSMGSNSLHSISNEKSQSPVDEPTVVLKVPDTPPPSPIHPPILHYQTRAVEVMEEFYGNYVDPSGCNHHIKKFTWKNYNKLTVSVITYGARIITMKAPDKRGKVVDVLLGFDDIGGQVRNGNYPLGACLGRCANYIRDGVFYMDKNVSYLSKNQFPHHHNGGYRGFDKVVWTPHVNKSKVIMCYVSSHNEEGYPGQLFNKITFELCNRNQFRIEYEAYCTEPTVVNLTHHCYFNLAGSNQGPEEMRNHILTINANCYTVQDETKIPTGEIRNVVNTRFDFQIPKCLNKVIGITPNDGYNQNFCVNAGADQEECFVSRIFHPPSGRMLEIYSSHKGAVFSTGNEFGTGAPLPLQQLVEKSDACSLTSLVVNSIYRNINEILEIDREKDYFEMRSLIDLIKSVKIGDVDNLNKIELTMIQREYLERIFHYCHACEPRIEQCDQMLRAIEAILSEAKPDRSSEFLLPSEAEDVLRERLMSHFSARLEEVEIAREQQMLKNRKIVGKTDYMYKAHCGISITPQNYPNAINTKEFPSCVLKPGEVYKQCTSFRFWVRAGNPNNWIKRKIHEATYEEKEAARSADKAKAAKIFEKALKNKN